MAKKKRRAVGAAVLRVLALKALSAGATLPLKVKRALVAVLSAS